MSASKQQWSRSLDAFGHNASQHCRIDAVVGLLVYRVYVILGMLITYSQ